MSRPVVAMLGEMLGDILATCPEMASRWVWAWRGGQILAFSIDLLRRPYNTLALPCECVIINFRLWEMPAYIHKNTVHTRSGLDHRRLKARNNAQEGPICFLGGLKDVNLNAGSQTPETEIWAHEYDFQA